MHELSIAVSLVEIAAEERSRIGDPRVLVVHVKVGELSGVVPEALAFAFDVATAGTPLAGARLAIDAVPVEVFCDVCDERRVLPSAMSLRCPVCETPALQVVSGRELALTALEIDDDGRENR